MEGIDPGRERHSPGAGMRDFTRNPWVLGASRLVTGFDWSVRRFGASSRQAVDRPVPSAPSVIAGLAAMLCIPGLAAQCLEVRVLDPASTPVPTAFVSTGSREIPVGSDGVVLICDLGDGPHSLLITAPGFNAVQLTVDGPPGSVEVVLEIETLTQDLVVVGSRAEARAVTESIVPVDLLPASEFAEQGDPDVLNQLRNVVPSFNVNVQPISGGAMIVRPANLRNLAPDHVLVLVNGKRRHRAALIAWHGNGVSDGSQGPDISPIPSIALRQVEVLRDGASAQYGSDAIAGVMNFTLKDSPRGGSFEIRTGQFYEGDGNRLVVAGNVGLPLGEGGFANLSLEYGNAEPTSRSVQRDDAAALIAAGNQHVRTPVVQVWGSPELKDDVKFFGNFGKLLGESTQAYGHTSYSSRKATGGFFFRNPNTRAGVYSIDRGRTLLVGDALDAQDGIFDGSANCPEVPIVDHVPNEAGLARVLADPNCFTFRELYPGGFTPQFGGYYTDSSLVGGLRGQFASGITWDASVGLGSSEVDFFIFDTVNASLGPESPTAFRPGIYRQEEFTLNLDFAYAASEVIHLAAGGEFRNEEFTIVQGDQPSWELGPYLRQGFSAGSNGFAGFSPLAAGSWDRPNGAVYGDIEISDALDRYTLDGAIRAERFAGFGGTVNGKIAGRVELGRGLALRTSWSTGFRAPTPGQQNAYNLSSQWDPDLMDLVNVGTIPSTTAVAALRGGKALEPETSVNFTVGAVAQAGALSLTSDYFRIAISDRLALASDFVLTTDEVRDLLAEGVTSARNLNEFRFFTNDFDTLTQGIDIVATLVPAPQTEVTFLFNRTDTTVVQFNPEIVSALRIKQLQESLPKTRWNAALSREFGRFSVLARVSYYGGWFDDDDNQNYTGKHLADFEFSFKLRPDLKLAAGAQNAFNTFTDRSRLGSAGPGNLYSQFSPYGFDGGYYYLRLNYSWGTTF